MYGYIEGFTNTNNIKYCPKCGETVDTFYADGTAVCGECAFRFGVVESEEAEEK